MSKLETLETQTCTVAGRQYQVRVRLLPPAADDVPRLVIVSKLPDAKAVLLLQLCVGTIQKYTDTQYELWVVDNNSPEEHLQWLLAQQGINVVLNRSISEEGSFENGLALEMAARLVAQGTKYFMCLHQDTVVCKQGWLKYLLSKLNAQVKAAGVREDFGRVPQGILHVLGYVFEFQLYQELGLSFMPELPKYDVGDKLIVKLKEQGYQTFAARNSLWDESVVGSLPTDSPYKQLGADRSLDDEGDVFFMHLGRGVLKSKGEITDPTKTSIDLWADFAKKHLL